jgi:hypothetical protein
VPDLTPVEGDPFAPLTLTPVEHNPYDPLAASAGIAPLGPTPYGSSVLQSVINAATVPGDVTAKRFDVQPSGPGGTWTEEDQFRLDAANAEIANRTGALANVAMGGAMPIAAAERGALLGAGGGRAVIPEQPIAPPFHSAVERAVAEARTPQAPAAQWLGTLRNAPGVKPEELEHLGLEDFLKGQQGPVTKQALAEHIAANKVDLRETMKGSDPTAGNSLAQDIARSYVHPETLLTADDVAQARRFNSNFRATTEGHSDADILEAARLAHEASGKAQTKFQNYTLPGGENYRELLLTLPSANEKYIQFTDAMRAKYGDMPLGQMPMTEGEKAFIDKQINAYGDGNKDVFKSGHWDEPNVLAHVRFDDRNIGGDKTLHMAEVQSDWHQKGRREGYASDRVAEPRFVVYEQPRPDLGEGRTTWNVRDTRGQGGTGGFANQAQAEAGRSTKTAGVPDAPFKTTWPELALKRMLRYAAENGYDHISWDTGATNAERYDLSKHVDQITARRLSDGYELNVVGKNGESIFNNSHTERLTPDKLADTVGKEMAQKIIDDTKPASEHRASHVYNGLDLKVGGEGMKAFYDRMLPNVANRLVKKYGAKVEQQNVTKPGDITLDQVAADLGYGGWHTGLTPKMRARVEKEWEERRAIGNNAPVHSIKITPELRDQALHRGFPMFASGVPAIIPDQDHHEKLRESIAMQRFNQAIREHVARAKQQYAPTP